MRLSHLFYFFLFVVFTAENAVAQTCTGSVGDPVSGSENFGTGSNPGPALPANQTNLFYRPTCQIEDGEYSIVTQVVGCHPEGWHNVPEDHTPDDVNGYMMVVNASAIAQDGVFYYKKITGLCPNTTYTFSAYILNLIRKDRDGPDARHPDITFSIESTLGTFTTSTGKIEPTSTPQFFKYPQTPLCFTTGNTVTDVILRMTNNAQGGQGNDFLLDDIEFRPVGPNVLSTSPEITGNFDQICEGTSKTYQFNASVSDINYQNYQWQINRNEGAGWQDISLADNATANSNTLKLNSEFLNAAAGRYNYRVGVATNGGLGSINCRIYSNPLIIDVVPLPVVTQVSDLSICNGSVLEIPLSGADKYDITGPDGINITDQTDQILRINNMTSANTGTYAVTGKTFTGCTGLSSMSFNVTVLPPVAATVTPSAEICLGTSISLQATGGTTYQWFPAAGLNATNIADPVANPTQTTTYTVRVDNGACFEDKQVTVTVLQLPVATAPAAKRMFEGETITLDATAIGGNIVETSWSPVTDLDNPSSLTPKASPTQDITYTLTVRSASCGTSTSSVFIRVYKKVTVPNTFTPNGDGFNDVWNIRALDTYPESTTTVFSRSGQEVFRTAGYSQPWDGTLNGQQLPSGTYYYVINLNNGTKPLTGWVALLK